MTLKTKKKTKQELLSEAVTEAVGAGIEHHLESVDFSDPDRPKTCLEVDFPLLPINHVATIEGNAGKPIYQMSKWWARRRSSVFRSLLISAATKAPDDPLNAATTVWKSFYGNHHNNDAFRHLKVADIFMGGGTTIVEGSRLGMKMYGNDLNPVAWLIVKNELSQVPLTDVTELVEDIEAEVKPLLAPFYACDCPRGHKGAWTQKSTGDVMPDDFDPFLLDRSERDKYEYVGPEVIYTFWAKHGPCNAGECSHRTPIMSTPVVAVKKLSVKAWTERECSSCLKRFDIERHEPRMAPSAQFVLGNDELPYSTMDSDGHYKCPHCGEEFDDPAAASHGKSSRLGKAVNKKVDLTLLVHPHWLLGTNGVTEDGTALGGSVSDSAEATAEWNQRRSSSLSLIECRGVLPETITCPDTGVTFFTDKRGGTIPRKSAFVCKEETCGQVEDILTAIRSSGKSGPVAAYVSHGYCPECDADKQPYSGRFFDTPDHHIYDHAIREWEALRHEELDGYWPLSELTYGFMTHHNNGGIPNHGFTHWWTMFNPRQLVVLATLHKAIVTTGSHEWDAREFVLGAFEQYLRNQNMFCIWDISRDCMAPHFSNANYHPKANIVENSVFAKLGRGNWQSCTEAIRAGREWCESPWDAVPVVDLAEVAPETAKQITGKSFRIKTGDSVGNGHVVDCRSSSDLSTMSDATIDLVITDPPFGGLLHYSELADFFYVWLRLSLRDKYPEFFESEYTPKVLEAVANKARHPEGPDAFYQKLLTECWREAGRVLKPSGILAFTFHHSEDEPWVAVLESLFSAGFYLEAAYPIRSDETKGEGGKPGTFGSQLIEYDIIHVCRKRTEEPEPISWARLRRQIMRDVRELQDVLEQHENAGLQQADMQVIRRGKALEYYSRHYGKVYIERGSEDEFTVKDALLGINQLLDDERDTSMDSPPVTADPMSRQFLRLFADCSSLARDQVQKYLRGTGVGPSEFENRGWCGEKKKVFYLTPPLEFARQWKGQHRGGMSRDMDQALFLVGACYEESGIRVQDTLNSTQFKPHPAIADILDWLCRHGGDGDMKLAAQTAKKLYIAWEAKNKPRVEAQLRLFSDDDAED